MRVEVQMARLSGPGLGLARVATRCGAAIVGALLAMPMLAAQPSSGGNGDAAVLLAWNAAVYEIGIAEDELRTFKTHRAAAMMHLAVHDALNGIAPRYRRYLAGEGDALAAPVAATTQAAHDVLAAAYPAARPRLSALLAESLAGVAEPGRSRGVALGARSAAATVAARAGDGWDRESPYTFRAGFGAYQTTPPWDGFVAHPGFRQARPFVLGAPDQLRPPAPPPLDSASYATALAEVRAGGAADSAVRSADQSAYAVWWMEYPEASVNRLARRLVAERGIGLWPAARLFALLGVALYDSYVATWDAKFTFDHWRPYTAIRAAGPAATGGGDWQPMLPTPPFPEYVSAHAAGCGSAFAVLRDAVGDGAFAMSTTTAPPEMPERRFASYDAAAQECADSRVRLGWHFRYSTDAGLALGRAVAARVGEEALTPLGH
jgi:hypothetical protein